MKSNTDSNTFKCPVCKEEKNNDQGITGKFINSSVVNIIKKELPEWSTDNRICVNCLNRFRLEYVEEALKEEKGELTQLEDEVLHIIAQQELLSANVNAEFDIKLTLDQRIANKNRGIWW